jgi:hypothetical protein
MIMHHCRQILERHFVDDTYIANYKLWDGTQDDKIFWNERQQAHLDINSLLTSSWM